MGGSVSVGSGRNKERMRWKRKGLGGERGCVNDQGWFVVVAVISISEGGG